MNQNRSFIGVFLLIVGALFLLSLAVSVFFTQFSERQYRSTLKTERGYRQDDRELMSPFGNLVASADQPKASVAAAAFGSVDGAADRRRHGRTLRSFD